MDVSIIIVNYNTKEMTLSCINSIIEKTHDIQYEIILVDNASIDGSKNCFERDSRIIYKYSTENLGFGRANNLGYKYAKGRNIFLLNSDTYLLNNAIKYLSDFLDAHSDVGAVGGNLYDSNRTPTYSYNVIYPSIWRDMVPFLPVLHEKIKKGDSRIFNHTGMPMEVLHITGADLMIRKSVIEELGLFNPSFFMYYEETELCYRIHSQGYKLVSVPSAMITHLCGKSVLKLNSQMWKLEGRMIYFRLTGKSVFYRYADFLLNKTFLYVRYFVRMRNADKKKIIRECISRYHFE